jgi:hypothetical protein
MLGTVFHYAVVQPMDDHAQCEAQKDGIIAMHERMGYRKGGAYNGHFCIHGQYWISYLGPNQATGNNWANLNLHAWCYLATVDTPVTPAAAQAAYDLTLVEPTGRDQIYPHSAFFATSCCGDPLREWINNGALPPESENNQEDEKVANLYITKESDPSLGIWATDGIWKRHVSIDEWNFISYVSPDKAKTVAVSDLWWNSTPTASATGGSNVCDSCAKLSDIRKAVREEIDKTKLSG